MDETPVTDRFRYLPCGLHAALAVPDWVVQPGGGPYRRDVWDDPDSAINLAHPAGWDHAVRALALLAGRQVPESASACFATYADGWMVMVTAGDTPRDNDGVHEWCSCDTPGMPSSDDDSPLVRREALCRCICAALGLDVEAVFPLPKVTP